MNLNFTDHKAADKETIEHLDNPVVGDRFTERYAYFIWVVRITPRMVWCADTSGMEKRYEQRIGKLDTSCKGELPIDLRHY